MIECKNCNTLNEEDAVFCKKCGLNLELDEFNDKHNKKEKKQKVKTKTKKKTKIKKVKEKPKKDTKNKSSKKKDIVVKKEMSIGQSLLMFFLILLCIILFGALGVAGYYIYNTEKVTVPSVMNLSYEEAELKLAKSDLKIKKIEKNVDDSSLENIVIDQNKKEGTTVRKNSVVKVSIGKYEEVYSLDDFTYMNIEQVKSILSSNNIKYVITYKDVANIDNNIVLSQSPKKGTKLEKGETVKLTVSKKKINTEKQKDKEEAETTDEKSEETSNVENEEEIEENTEQEE